MISKTAIRSAVGMALTLMVVCAAAQTNPAPTPAQIPVADFFRKPEFVRPKLSPDGRHVAVSARNSAGRMQLVVLEVGNLTSARAIASFATIDVENYQWANDKRLVFSVRDQQSTGRARARGLWAVDRDGGDSRQLIHTSFDGSMTIGTNIKDRRLPWSWNLHSVLEDGSDDVLVEETQFNERWEADDSNLARLNTRTGLSRNLATGAPPHVVDWVVDRKGEPTVLTTWHRGRVAAYVKRADGWKQWQEADGIQGKFATPYWVGPDGSLLVKQRGARDTEALHRVDMQTLAIDPKPLVSTPGYDFAGELVYDNDSQRLLGVHYETDAYGTAWLDAGLREAQAEVDKLLPATINRIDCRRCASIDKVVVTAVSDRVPVQYYLYDRKQKKLEPVASSRPWIDPRQMGMRDIVRVKTRDGLDMPVLITQPAGKAAGPRPTVLLVHGGPFVRGTHWAWDAEAQFLASRGYVVIEPDFRGSMGYGWTHYRAGWKQWGLGMQDDLADALQWAVKEGHADPQRVCIAGASYGGYATLMGLIKQHELFRCGINWVGVSDINLMYSISWSDSSEEQQRYGMPALIGDPVQDAAQLKATSPLERAAEVRRPLLMAYGAMDRRVPIKHGTAFRDAVMKTNKDVEWIAYPHEGHGWFELETNVDFWTRVEKFLDRHIGAAAAGAQ